MKRSENDIVSILEKHRDAPMVNPNRIYPPLPPVENVAPLFRVPEKMSMTEKIGGTEYMVNAHFREGGRDLLSMLSGIFSRNITGNEYGYGEEVGYDDEI